MASAAQSRSLAPRVTRPAERVASAQLTESHPERIAQRSRSRANDATRGAIRLLSLPHMAVAGHDVLVGRQLAQPARAAGVEPVRTDADFRAQAQLEPVVEPRARVH